MTHERLQQLLAWIDEIHWEGDDRTKVDELVSYIDSSTSAPHRRASLGGRINELENLWADASRRAEKAEARVRELEAESSTWAKACGEEMRKRQSMEANWENMAANNREFCARAAKAEAERDALEGKR